MALNPFGNYIGIKNEGRILSLLIFMLFRRLLLNNSLSRALSSARTALKTLIGIDLVVQIAHVDSFSGTLCCARTAGQALVGNNKSHDDTSMLFSH
jgi:hypothetical protein